MRKVKLDKMIDDWEINLSLVTSRRLLPLESIKRMNDEDFKELSAYYSKTICEVFKISPSQLGAVNTNER